MPIQANKIIQTHNMATAAQKKNIARFKAVQAEAKKLKAKNKSLSHIQAVKQAWVILYSKEKKSPSKTTKKRKVGALPIGFTGKILNVPFKVVNQFDIYDEVNAIVENTDTGKKIITIDGKTSTKDLADKFFAHIKMNVDYEKGDIPKDTLQRISKFVIGLSKEVKDYNAGKKQTIKKQPLIIAAKKSSAAKKSPSPKKSKVVKIKKTATKKSSSSGSKKLTYVGVRKLESGASRYEYKLAGIPIFEYKVSRGGKFYVTTNIPMKGVGVIKVGDGKDHKRGLPTYVFTETALKKVQKMLGKENTTYIESDY